MKKPTNSLVQNIEDQIKVIVAKTKPTAHTPTPWRQMTKDGLIILGGDGNGVSNSLASVWSDGRKPEEALDNAAFIVRAVNSHDELLKVVKELVHFDDHQDQSDWTLLVDAAREAIANAKAEGGANHETA